MSTTAAWRAGVASDRGLQRSENEDRVYVDEAAGIFLVVDGVGGEAAGERAAETAADIIPRELGLSDGAPEQRVREAITAANNAIFEQARNDQDCHGMACVLTLAFASGGRITIGHVGDSRLYLAWDGKLRKLTSDHSPVGEQEDQGELTEEEAMHHPRRNEVFRDVGSRLREADAGDFIDVRSFPFHPDAAFLLCSDGLTDVVPSAEISAIVETYEGDPEGVAHELVDAANRAGGKDNVSVVFVAGPEFMGTGAQAWRESRPRHAITRPRRTRIRWRTLASRSLWLLAGMLLGIGFWMLFPFFVPRPASAIRVNASDPHGIEKAINAAQPGATIVVPPGDYLGPIELKANLSLMSEKQGAAVIRADGSAGSDAGIALVARGGRGRVNGFRIEGTAASPLQVGVLMAGSQIEIEDLEITGARDCGVRIQGNSTGVLRANYIHSNSGCGVQIAGQGSPRLAGNRISDNGARGVEIDAPASGLLDNNIISGNAIKDFGAIPPGLDSEIRRRNIVD